MKGDSSLPPPINDWISLASLIESNSDGTWIFRGETQSFQTLKPRAGRTQKTEYSQASEEKSLDLFKKQARPYLGHSPSSDLEWLAIAQHHGMWTRLLDWTESLLVAAYFATEKAGTAGDAVIYGVQGLRTITEEEEGWPFESHEGPGIYHPPHITSRIPAQRSVFTVHSDPMVPFSPPSLSRWVITSSACNSIKRILDACAINNSSLFPDLDGLSTYIAWRYKWGKL